VLGLPVWVDDEGLTHMPVVTAAFWGIGDRLTAAEPWADVFTDGADIPFEEFSDPDLAVADRDRRFLVSRPQAEIVHELYRRRRSGPHGATTISLADLTTLVSRHAALGRLGWSLRARVDWATHLLAAVGVAVEPVPWR
jgi:hypothetical protein